MEEFINGWFMQNVRLAVALAMGVGIGYLIWGMK